MVSPPARRDSEVRREPAQALPGHLQRQLGLTRVARAVGRAARRDAQVGAAAASRCSGSTTRTQSRSSSGRWLIEQVHARDRDVVFLAEAFTKRSVMRHLGKIGFSQSYTYFTWKNASWELIEYVSELAYSGEQEYFRPNFFANTPDILHAYLQHGGRAGVRGAACARRDAEPQLRHLLGLRELENVAVREGSEEYLRLREVRAQDARARRRTVAADRSPERDQARVSARCSGCRTSPSSRPRTRR